MKIEVKVCEQNSVIEKITYEDSSTDMERPIYKIKGAPVMIDGLIISRKDVKYVSLSKIADSMYKYKNGSGLVESEAARKRLERHLECALQKIGIDSYKEDLQIPYRRRMKYQFSDEDIPFLRELVNREIVSDEDLYWAAVGIYSCFCHIKDIDEELLEDIGNAIQQKIGFSELKFVVALKNRLESINSFSNKLAQSNNYSKEEKRHIYENVLKSVDDLIQQWNELL